MPGGEALSLAEAVERLGLPEASELFSPLTGQALLLVDLGREGRRLSADELARAAQGLTRLPAPSVALRSDPLPASARTLLPGFDLVLDEDRELAALRASVRERPLASMALVQLLRHGAARSVEAGLVAESLVYATLQAGPEFAAWLETRKPPSPAAPETEPAVRVHRELDRLQLRLNRPRRRNAFSAEMRDALCEALALALTDRSIVEVVLSGEGPAFCAGGDLAEFGALPDPATAHAVRSTRNAARLLAECASRVRAELHGACIGAGIELPAFAARVVAREDLSVQLPELAMGLVPGAGGTVSLPRRIGRQRTAWLALTGAVLEAPAARAWGLVDELRS